METPGQRRTKGVTIADVARLAGVATSTVSRALSHPGRVSAATARKVREAADELGYRQEDINAPLPQRGAKLIVVMVFDLSHPFYFDVLRGIQDEAHSAGYEILLIDAHSDERAERESVERVIGLAAGVILVSPRMSDASVAQLAKQRPTVVVNRDVRDVASINQDTTHGMRQAVAHLAGLGHKSLTYIPGPEVSRIDGMRRHAIEQACRIEGLAFRRLSPTDASLIGGTKVAEQWVQHRTSAVIAFNDNTAVGFIRSLARLGFQVPRDVSVIGVDNLALGVVHDPRLTTVAFAGYAQGAAATRQVLGSHSRVPQQARFPSVPMKLIVRESTGPAPTDS